MDGSAQQSLAHKTRSVSHNSNLNDLNNHNLNDYNEHTHLLLSLSFPPDLLQTSPLALSTLRVSRVGMQNPSRNPVTLPPVLSCSPPCGSRSLDSALSCLVSHFHVVPCWGPEQEVYSPISLPNKQKFYHQGTAKEPQREQLPRADNCA